MLRTHLLIGMPNDGTPTVVDWQSLISGNPDEKSGATIDQTEAQLAIDNLHN